MITNLKQPYCSPETEVLVIRHEGVICTSDPMLVVNPFDENEEEEW